MDLKEVKIDSLAELENPDIAWIDVRSESEFKKGSIPGFSSHPILTDSERHEVGKRYKMAGQDSAIRLGEKLTLPFKDSRTQAWIQLALEQKKNQIGFICWRGGLRSQIASEWTLEKLKQSKTNLKVIRFIGGYKAIRKRLLEGLEQNRIPKLLVVSGYTGCGKSRFLNRIRNELNQSIIDLEAHAEHRGSAFGLWPGHVQPSQATFENRIALNLFQNKNDSQVHFIEDESAWVGSVHIPFELKKKMEDSTMIIIQEPIGYRSQLIFEDYIQEPLNKGISEEFIKNLFTKAFESIRKRLGHERTDDLIKKMHLAFLGKEKHPNWIESLLVDYYDKRYEYHRTLRNRKIAFQGSQQECFEWIRSSFRL